MELATLGQRFIGALVDGLISLVPYILIRESGPEDAMRLGALLALVLIFGVQAYFLARDGQTLGKKAAGTRIVRVDDESNGGFFTNVLMRAIVSSLPNIVPLYWFVDTLFVFRADRRCIHDLIAKTKVVKARSSSAA